MKIDILVIFYPDIIANVVLKLLTSLITRKIAYLMIFISFNFPLLGAYSKPGQTSKVKLFAKIVKTAECR